MEKFDYGGHFRKYDMSGEIHVGTGIVQVHDIMEGVLPFMMSADLLFVDPPCHKGNLKSFYTKAGIPMSATYDTFNEALFGLIDRIRPKRLFIEVFRSNKEIMEREMKGRYINVSVTQSYYYHDKQKLCWIIQASDAPLYDIPYLDEQYVIEWICQHVHFACIGDPCMGRGLVGFYANKHGRQFVGTELNSKRLAVLIERINKNKL